MNSPLTPQTLQTQNEYELLSVLPHADLMLFVQQQIKVKNKIRLLFYGANIAVVTAIALVVFLRNQSGTFQGMDVLLQSSLGFFLFFLLLLPLHEFIHGLAYKYVGAPKVKYVAQWRKLIFYAMADGFVAGRKPFMLVAFAPFVVITLLLVLGFLTAGMQTEFIFLSALLFHTSGCIGDFALVSYYYSNKDKELYTYDDALAAKTYFYARKKSEVWNLDF